MDCRLNEQTSWWSNASPIPKYWLSIMKYLCFSRIPISGPANYPSAPYIPPGMKYHSLWENLIYWDTCTNPITSRLRRPQRRNLIITLRHNPLLWQLHTLLRSMWLQFIPTMLLHVQNNSALTAIRFFIIHIIKCMAWCTIQCDAKLLLIISVNSLHT